MSPQELQEIGVYIYGEGRGMQARLAEDLGKTSTSISRYLDGSLTIPEDVAKAASNLKTLHKVRGILCK